MNFSSFFKIATAVIIIALTATACSKTELTDNNEQQVYDRTEQKILDFKEKLKHADKSSETMSIDSAVWYIEAALNYSYCIISEQQAQMSMNKVKTDSFSVSYINQNGLISVSDVSQIYDNLEEKMLTLSEETDSEAKYFSVVDVEYDTSAFKITPVLRYNEGLKSPVGMYHITEDW